MRISQPAGDFGSNQLLHLAKDSSDCRMNSAIAVVLNHLQGWSLAQVAELSSVEPQPSRFAPPGFDRMKTAELAGG